MANYVRNLPTSVALAFFSRLYVNLQEATYGRLLTRNKQYLLFRASFTIPADITHVMLTCALTEENRLPSLVVSKENPSHM